MNNDDDKECNINRRHFLRKAGAVGLAGFAGGHVVNAMASSVSPDFVKSIPLERAMDGEIMLAYAMNGKELPMLNGYPLKLIVPGWFGTYWVKHVNEIILSESDGLSKMFYMGTATASLITAAAISLRALLGRDLGNRSPHLGCALSLPVI